MWNIDRFPITDSASMICQYRDDDFMVTGYIMLHVKTTETCLYLQILVHIQNILVNVLIKYTALYVVVVVVAAVLFLLLKYINC